MKVNNKELEMAVLGCSGATIGARNPVLKAINMRVNVEEISATNSQILIKKVVAYEEDGDSDSKRHDHINAYVCRITKCQ